MPLRAYWQHTSRHNETDRIEIHDPNFSGTAFELCGNETGFSFKHDVVTAESNNALLNVHANEIQVGKLDLKPRIKSAQGESLFEDIRDSVGNDFTIHWLKDGNLWWTGTVTTRIFQYPEKLSNYFGKIRATDFDVLKNIDFPFVDQRQTLITTLSDIFDELPVPLEIVTRTSWTEEHLDANITGDYDFLNQIYHDTKSLRDFADSDSGTDRHITYFDALKHTAEAAIFVRQLGGKIYIEQLTELKDPQNINETVYNADGTVKTPMSVVSRTQQGYTSVDAGTPAVKITSSNESYPAIKRARVTFNHRSDISVSQFPKEFRLTYNPTEDVRTLSNTIVSDGEQTISITGSIQALVEDVPYNDQPGARVEWELAAGGYNWDNANEQWISSSITNNEWLPLDQIITTGEPGQPSDRLYKGSFGPIETVELPPDADGVLVLTVHNALSYAAAEYTDFTNVKIEINNQIGDNESSSIDYQLTQTAEADQLYEADPTWYGDGPSITSPSQLRYGAGSGAITSDSWGRRGGADVYRNFHFNLLKEIIDIQRFNTRKIEADIWGAYDPTKIFSYNGVNYFYAGGSYDGVSGAWNVTLMKLSVNTSTTDDFQDIINFDSAENGLIADAAYSALSIAQKSQQFNRSQKITTTSGDISGTITEIPIVPILDVFIMKGDPFYVFDIRSAQVYQFTLAEVQMAGDESLVVESKTIADTIPVGSWVIYTGEKISTYITRSDESVRLGVRDFDLTTYSNGENIIFTGGEELSAPIKSHESLFQGVGAELTVQDDRITAAVNDIEGNEASLVILSDRISTVVSDVDGNTSLINQLSDEIVLKVNSDGEIAAISLTGDADDGSVISIVADEININNIVIDSDAGTISTTNFQEGVQGWQITGAGDAEFNSVVLRNGLMEDSDIRNLTIAGTLAVPSGQVKIGEGIYDSQTLGPQDGMVTAGGDALFSNQGIDLDARSGTAGQIEWHDTTAHGNEQIFFGTQINLSNNTIFIDSHGFVDNEIVQFSSTGDIPTPISPLTDYYIVNATADGFQISTSEGGNPVDITADGTGDHSVFYILDDLTSNANLVGELQVNMFDTEQRSSLALRAQSVAPGWETEILLSSGFTRIMGMAGYSQQNESISGTNEQAFSVDKSKVYITVSSGEPVIVRIDGLPADGLSYPITLINETAAGNDFLLRDLATAGGTVSNPNIRTQNHDDLRIYDGAAIACEWDGQEELLYVGVDRGN